MASIAIALVIIASVAFIGYPFFARWRADETLLASSGDATMENLIVQRDATYAAIKDIESDHAMGKLSDLDYKTLRSKYEGKAVAILQELDGYHAATNEDDEEAIEQQGLVAAVGQDAAGGSKCWAGLLGRFGRHPGRRGQG